MTIRSKTSLLLLVVLHLTVSLVLLPVDAAVKKQSIDYDALERAWETGDAREELRSPGDEQFEALSEKCVSCMCDILAWEYLLTALVDVLYLRSEQEAKELGAQMVFVTLREDRANAQELLTEVASRWKEVHAAHELLNTLNSALDLTLFACLCICCLAQSLWNGGLEVTIYEIEEGKKLLVGLQRGIQTADLRRFLSEQPDVLEFEWNSKTYEVGNKQQQRHQKKTRKKSKKAAAKNSKTEKRKLATQTSNTQEPKSEL